MKKKLVEKQAEIDKAKAEARAKRWELAHGKPDPERYSPMKLVGGKDLEKKPEESKEPTDETPDSADKKSHKEKRFDSISQDHGEEENQRERNGDSDDDPDKRSDEGPK